MSRKLQYITGGIMCIVGGALQALFLISDRMMKSPVTYVEGARAYKFNIGFHWTTLIGMLGVLMLVMGIRNLIKAEKYVLGAVAAVAFLINVSGWEFFLDTSITYYDLVLEYDGMNLWGYRIACFLSSLLMIALLIIMLYKRNEQGVTISYRVVSVVVLLLSIGGLIFKTICNQWYLVQAIFVIVLTWILCSGKILYNKWKRNGEEKNGK